MKTESTTKIAWQIDRILEPLIGQDVRVAAQAFSPARWTGDQPPRMRPVRDLFLPDNSQPAGLPVFFEGRLERFERQVGVVFVCLEAPTTPETAGDGPVYFRGQMAVILRGPAVVQLAFPFQVERLPVEADNYWRDVRLPRAQFELPFPAGSHDDRPHGASTAFTSFPMLRPRWRGRRVSHTPNSPEMRLAQVGSPKSARLRNQSPRKTR